MKNDYREIVIKDKRSIGRLERFIEEICDYYNIHHEYFGNVMLATTEAAEILMTINQREFSEGIVIRFDRNSKGLIFTLRMNFAEEQEKGKEDVLDIAIRTHQLEKEIYIVKSLADEVTISLNGKSIILIFYVSSMNYEKSLDRINRLKGYWKLVETATIKK